MRRAYREVSTHVDGWVQQFAHLSQETITWQVWWSEVPGMAVSNMRYQRMVIAGLSCWTFYIPYRVLRQHGIRQVVPPTEDFVAPNFNAATFRAYQRNWRERVVVPRDPLPSVVLPRSCERWIATDLASRESEN